MDEELEQPEEQFNAEVEENGAESSDFAPEAEDGASSPVDCVVADGPETAGHVLPFPIVGIGASAGGVEAYIELFQNLSSKTGMAFVIVPHLQADQTSYLPEILARHTSMAMAVIKNGMRPQPDHVYLLPPNASVSLQAGVFHLEKRKSDGAFHPIDSFLRSLAAEQRNFAVGVVLSGMDSDGAMGLKTIKSEAGITIVQSPESARFPDMPRSSISADHVDMVLPPGQIARYLSELAARFQEPVIRRLEEGVAPADEDRQFQRIFRLLKGISGIDFGLYKPTTVRRRMARRMLMHRVKSLAEYVSLLQQNPKEIRDLQEDILISVTRFFRDPEVFEALKRIVLFPLFESESSERQVRIWVAGCSTGEEVYSIAMCLTESLGTIVFQPSIQIFGTDASEISIQKARLGIYPETITNEVSPERLRRFFTKTEKGYQVAKRIRDLCIFARQNLCTDPPFSRLDLVSCRNVLIYFDPRLQRQVIPTFHYALRSDGYLLLGNSETIRQFTDIFSLTDRKNKIYSKIGVAPGRAISDGGPRVFSPDLSFEVAEIGSDQSWSDLELQRAADRIVLSRFGPPGFVVNENLEILQSRGHTSPFLELAQGTASLQLARMIRESITPQVITAVKRAIEYSLPVQIDRLSLRDGDETHETTLEVLPMHNLGSRSKCYLVLFVPSTQAARSQLDALPASEPLPANLEQDDYSQVVSRLQNDLSTTRLYLQSLLEERDVKNQELISANEEIQSANEELQSTNEELETTKEELQSSNEELQTVNDELQNRNTVLTQASNDLLNLLNSVNLPVLMLSNELNIRHFTPQTQRVMSVRASDIGRPFGDIRLNLDIENLEPLFMDVLDTLGPREMEVQDRDGHWYLLRVRPYRTTDNKIDGLVVALVDIDQLRRGRQELRDARDFARSIIESVPLPLVVVDSEFRIRSTNAAFCALTGLTSEALDMRLLPNLAALLWGIEEPLMPLLQGLRGKKNGDSFEFEHRTSGEKPRIFVVRGRVLQPDGERFVLVTFEDATAHKELERLLKSEGQRLTNKIESTTKELTQSREELHALTGNLLSSQEEERRRLARELHDDVSQRLAAIKIAGDQLLAAVGQAPAPAREKLEDILAQMGQLSDDVRALSHSLHPSIIEDLGLESALRSLTQEFGEREGMITTFFSEGVPPDLPIDLKTGLYRIAQEALRNVSKHAGKTHVKVQLQAVPGGIELQITDSGRGFNPQQQHPGLGLISMKERARLISGSVNVKSAVREGTTVAVFVAMPPAGR